MYDANKVTSDTLMYKAAAEPVLDSRFQMKMFIFC